MSNLTYETREKEIEKQTVCLEVQGLAGEVHGQYGVEGVAAVVEELSEGGRSAGSPCLLAVTGVESLIHEHSEGCEEVRPWRK